MPPKGVLKWFCKPRKERAPSIKGITQAMAALKVAKAGEPEEVPEPEPVPMEEAASVAKKGQKEKKSWWKWNEKTQKYDYFEFLHGKWWKQHIRWELMPDNFWEQ